MLDTVSHSFALLTREISWSTLEINNIFPHIHVLFSMYTLTSRDKIFRYHRRYMPRVSNVEVIHGNLLSTICVVQWRCDTNRCVCNIPIASFWSGMKNLQRKSASPHKLTDVIRWSKICVGNPVASYELVAPCNRR